MSLCRELGNRHCEALSLEGQALVAFHQGQREQTAHLLCEASLLRQTYGLPLAPVDQPVLLPLYQALSR